MFLDLSDIIGQRGLTFSSIIHSGTVASMYCVFDQILFDLADCVDKQRVCVYTIIDDQTHDRVDR